MNTPNMSTNLDISQSQAVKCTECGSTHFKQALHLRKVSSILTGTGKPGYIPIPVFACLACDHVNEEFLPKEIKKLEK